MSLDGITPDQIILFEWNGLTLNATIAYTWAIMALLTVASWLITRKLSTGAHISRWQNLIEIIVVFVQNQIREITEAQPDRYLCFIGSLFIFIGVANLLEATPGYHAPTASLSTTTALAICVLFAVPIFGIAEQGLLSYLRHYIRPSVFMAPFHILGEITRTLALAVRLFGNMMSGAKIGAILLAIIPLFFPVIMNALGLLIGLIQAYIFAVLAMVYIAASLQRNSDSHTKQLGQFDEKGEKQNG